MMTYLRKLTYDLTMQVCCVCELERNYMLFMASIRGRMFRLYYCLLLYHQLCLVPLCSEVEE